MAGECASGLQRVQLDMALPVVFGVLTTENLEQALARAGGALGNKGTEAAATAIEMATVLRQLSGTAGPRAGRPPSRRKHRPLPEARPSAMLRLVLPKGSLEQATFELFTAADLAVRRASDVDYRATIDDPRVDEVHILRPQEIPIYVAEGLFDLGVTGRDWVEETGADVVSLGELHYSKATTEPDQGRARRRCRLAGAEGRGSPAGLPGLDRVPAAHEAVLGGAGSRSRCPFLLRGDRGEDP